MKITLRSDPLKLRSDKVYLGRWSNRTTYFSSAGNTASFTLFEDTAGVSAITSTISLFPTDELGQGIFTGTATARSGLVDLTGIERVYFDHAYTENAAATDLRTYTISILNSSNVTVTSTTFNNTTFTRRLHFIDVLALGANHKIQVSVADDLATSNRTNSAIVYEIWGI